MPLKVLSLFPLCFLVSFFGYSQNDTLFLNGSNGVRPLVVEVAKAFEKEFPNIRVEIGSGMSTQERITALLSGEIDIAMASHGIDIPSFTRKGLQVHWFAKMAVVIGVHSGVPLRALTQEEICAIYNAEITNWKELGGPDQLIVVLARPADEVDTEVLQSHWNCLSDPTTLEEIIVFQKSGKLAEALMQTSGAIGMCAAVRVQQSEGRIQPLIIDGVKPSLNQVRKDRYPYQRNAYLITRNLEDPAVKRFVQFFRTRTAKKILARNAAVMIK